LDRSDDLIDRLARTFSFQVCASRLSGRAPPVADPRNSLALRQQLILLDKRPGVL